MDSKARRNGMPLRALSMFFVLIAVVMISVPVFGALNAPDNVQVSYIEGGVSISWDAVPNATQYNIYQSTDNTTFTLLGNTTKLGFTVTNLTSGTYYFKIEAANSTQSNATVVTVKYYPPAVPDGVTLKEQGGKIMLQWNAVANASGYYVYKGTSSGNETLLKTVAGTNYTDADIVGGNTYYYYVVTYNSTGLSAHSVEVSMSVSAGSGVISAGNISFSSYIFALGAVMFVIGFPLLLYGAKKHEDVAAFSTIGGVILLVISYAVVRFGYGTIQPVTIGTVALNTMLAAVGTIFLVIGVALVLAGRYDRKTAEHMDVGRFSLLFGILALMMSYVVTTL